MTRSWALALAVGLIGMACTGDSPVVTPPLADTTPEISPPPQGGSVVFGAEAWPECLNPITGCTLQPWTRYAVLQHVLPRAMELDPAGNYVASPLLVEAPSLENGGLDPGPPFRVIFRIRQEAIWDDGTPISSEDFAFTWRALLSTRHSAWVPYERIVAVDAANPRTAVVTLDELWAGWPELFGGTNGFLFKRSWFSDLAEAARPNLRQQLRFNIPFSGGPFRLSYFGPDKIVLLRNPNYWGTRANLARVVFVPTTELSVELARLADGRVAGIYLIAPQLLPGLLPSQFLGMEDVEVVGGEGTSFEALWFQNDEPPLNNPKVREALMYAIDRQALLDIHILALNPGASVLNCGLGTLPQLGPWCQARPFERFSYDPARARSILEEAGYRCGVGVCTKKGRRLAIKYFTFNWTQARALTQLLIIHKAESAGIELKPGIGGAGGVYFWEGGCGEAGNFGLMRCDRTANTDGSVTDLLACDRVPTEDNLFTGENFIHWCNREATALMHASDRELDPTRRLELLTRVYELQAEDLIGLPLYVVPVVSAWRTDKIAGPIGLYSSTHHGMFFNMNEWYVPA